MHILEMMPEHPVHISYKGTITTLQEWTYRSCEIDGPEYFDDTYYLLNALENRRSEPPQNHLWGDTIYYILQYRFITQCTQKLEKV
jgi:hypothetical protein